MPTAKIAALLLSLAALGGLTLAIIRLRGAPRPPTLLAVLHGLIAASGLLTLIYTVLTQEITSLAKVASVVLIGAALGGGTLFLGFHVRNRALPVPLVFVHGLVAATGLALLLKALFAP